MYYNRRVIILLLFYYNTVIIQGYNNFKKTFAVVLIFNTVLNK